MTDFISGVIGQLGRPMVKADQFNGIADALGRGIESVGKRQQLEGQKNEAENKKRGLLALSSVLKSANNPEQAKKILNQALSNGYLDEDDIEGMMMPDGTELNFQLIGDVLKMESKGLLDGQGEDFTLGEGQVRYDKRGNVVAQNQKSQKVKEVTVGNDIYLIDENSGETLKILKGSNQNQLEFKDQRSVINDVTSLTKKSKDIYSSARSLEALGKSKSSTDQLAAVFKFMKALDPASVVREGEQDQARSTGGITDVFLTYVEKLQTGDSLPPKVFNNMTLTAKKLANSDLQDARNSVDGYLSGYSDMPDDFYSRQTSRVPSNFKLTALEKLPSGSVDLGNGSFKLPNGTVVRPKGQ